MIDFVVQDGSTIYYPPFEMIKIHEELNKGYDGTLTVSYPDIKKYASAFGLIPDNIFASSQVEWYLRKDGVKIFGGIFLSRNIYGGSGMTQYVVNLADFSYLLDKRRTSNFWQRISTDSGVIVNDLLDYTNNLLDTGIRMGNQPSLKVRNLTARFEKVRDVIIKMSALKKKDGYDWDVDVTKKLNLYTMRGSNKPELIFDEFNTISFQSYRELQGRLTNKVIVLGKGMDDDMVYSVRENTTSQGTWGLLEDTLSEKGVSDVNELSDRGDSFLNENSMPTDVISLAHKDGSPDITSYGVGDTVTVRFNEINYNQSLRIYKRTIQTDGSDTTVNLSFI